MIDLHYAPTPNGWKISIMLEELGLPYRVIPINIRAGEQFSPEFLAISPNNRIPAIVDHAPADGQEPFSVFETGAILIYLADKTGRFLPKETRARSSVMEWLMWQMSGLGPMLGQNGNFALYAAEKIPYAIERSRTRLEKHAIAIERQCQTAPCFPRVGRSGGTCRGRRSVMWRRRRCWARGRGSERRRSGVHRRRRCGRSARAERNDGDEARHGLGVLARRRANAMQASAITPRK